MDTRTQILTGTLTLPSVHQFTATLGIDTSEVASRMFKSAWESYLLNKGNINLTYWARQFNSVKNFNSVLKILSNNNWFESHSIPQRNWAEASLLESKLLTYVSPDELAKVRADKKFAKYMPELMCNKVGDLTRQNGKVRNTGLTRPGLKASAGTVFSYDTYILAKYEVPITINVNKGMAKCRATYTAMASDSASYDAVATTIVQAIRDAINEEYTLGRNNNDWRGRSIKEGLSKVANPIGYKDFRSLLLIPEEFRTLARPEDETSIYLFIAELVGFSGGSVLDKELFGVECYNQRKLHTLDLANEADRKELHENIWLERLYMDLEQYQTTEGDYYWEVPIELDATASLKSYMGLLMGSKVLLECTNTSYTGVLNSAWYVEGLPKDLLKAAAMPILYGSSEPCEGTWRKAEMSYTSEHVVLFNKALTTPGTSLYIANKFKEFILRWVKPQEVMNISLYEDEFTIECNKFRNVGETTTRYDIYDSVDKVVRRVSHTETKRVPCLDQFRLSFVTLCIHGIDSQVMNFVMENLMDKYSWGIDIHDAILCSPSAATDVRAWYAEELDLIYVNRKAILTNFFNSIGIGAEAKTDWDNLMSQVEQVEEFKASGYSLK